jgi:hypothetical protein
MRNNGESAMNLIKRVKNVGDENDWILFLEMLGLKEYSVIQNFPPPPRAKNYEEKNKK